MQDTLPCGILAVRPGPDRHPRVDWVLRAWEELVRAREQNCISIGSEMFICISNTHTAHVAELACLLREELRWKRHIGMQPCATETPSWCEAFRHRRRSLEEEINNIYLKQTHCISRTIKINPNINQGGWNCSTSLDIHPTEMEHHSYHFPHQLPFHRHPLVATLHMVRGILSPYMSLLHLCPLALPYRCWCEIQGWLAALLFAWNDPKYMFCINNSNSIKDNIESIEMLLHTYQLLEDTLFVTSLDPYSLDTCTNPGHSPLPPLYANTMTCDRYMLNSI